MENIWHCGGFGFYIIEKFYYIKYFATDEV